ncbi:hypothetical protein FB451DRAFT_1204314 [Mycena latifolia]|nr:hypothetical protein FB451DRAFT_1204314 [Mycena latifolia]
MSARIFTSSVLRRARPLAIYHAHLPHRTLFGFGAKPPPPAPDTPAIDQAELAKTKRVVEGMFKDKPEAINAIVKFGKVLEESGVKLSSGQMPGPVQLMKLASNEKFREAYSEVQAELKNSGIDIGSKEFLDQVMKLVKQLPRGP